MNCDFYVTVYGFCMDLLGMLELSLELLGVWTYSDALLVLHRNVFVSFFWAGKHDTPSCIVRFKGF
jgi:hypothetical protein